MEKTPEDQRIEAKLADLKVSFPTKRFQIVGEPGAKRVEVLLDW